jgi:predicted ATPase/DNA-binding SARP family transcriptional activator
VSTDEAPVVLSVLGPLRVERAGRPVKITAALQQQVLAQLAAARGRRVGDDLLLECLWAEGAPPAAVDNLRALVSRLRRAVDPLRAGVVVREHGGYCLSRDLVDVDDEDPQAALGAALGEPDLSRRLALFDDALAAWRGDPYSGLPDVGPVGVEQARLRTVRDTLRVERLAAMVDCGLAGVAVPELQALTASNAVRERASELLALAQYRTGHQVEALSVLRQVRSQLLEEHGLDPGRRLQRMEAAILRQDPSLDPPAPHALTRPTPEQDAAHQTLPRPLTALLGRAVEVARIGDLVDEHRLVTLVGIGGSGKTRLAIATAATRPSAWFVDLTSARTPALLVDSISIGIGVAPSAGEEGLISVLSGSASLLVLDNCEDLLPDVADVAAGLLTACPELRILATSRLPLGVPGERVFNVPPLAVTAAAVELFRQRAASAGAEPEGLRDEHTIRRICSSLGGLPLALEIAAAQCRVLSVQQVADQLDEGFDLPEPRSHRRDRGESLSDIVTWSVDRLEPAAREAFQRLAVLDGDFDLVAVRALGGDVHPVSLLMDLLDAGLLVGSAAGTGGHRYRMLEPLRGFARRTTPAVARARAEAAHARWVTDLVTVAEGQLRGSQSANWLRRLESEVRNVRAALRHLLEVGDALRARQLAGAMGWFWYRRGHVQEGLAWYAEVLAAPAGECDPMMQRATGRCTLGAGMLHYLAGHPEQLPVMGQAAAAAARSCGDAQTEGLAMAYLAYVFASVGDLDAMRRASDRADEAAASAPSWVLADVLMIQGQLHRALGDLDEATRLLGLSFAAAEEQHHGWAAGSSSWIAGKVSLDAGRTADALAHGLYAARRNRAEGDLTSWLVSLHLVAGAAALRGRPEVGARLLGAVEARGARLGFRPESMDPLDSPRHVAAVRDRLTAEQFAREAEVGAGLGDDALDRLLAELDASREVS